MSQHDDLKNHQLEAHIHRKRVIIMALILCGLFIGVWCRLWHLQITQHERYATLSRHNQVHITPIYPSRGLILDRHGHVLARNTPQFALYLRNPHAHAAHTLHHLQQWLDVHPTSLSSAPGVGTLLKSHLSQEELATFFVNRHLFPDVDVIPHWVRHYPEGAPFAHVIGYTGQPDPHDLYHTHLVGKTGVEQAHNTALAGHLGFHEIEVNAKGHTVRTLTTTPAVPGRDLHLTLDRDLQHMIAKTLGNQPGAVVAVDPRDGGIVALVSTPSFDPAVFSQPMTHAAYQRLASQPHHPLFNRVTQGLYPPASTVKPLIALHALAEGAIHDHVRWHDPGWYRLAGQQHVYHDWKRQGHGWINLSRAIIESCDVFFYQLAHQLGIQHLEQAYRAFGLGRATGIDLPDESQGLVPSPAWKQQHKHEPWYPGETLITGIGQGFLLTTPLQLAQAAATLANRGVMRPMHVVQADTLSSHRVIYPDSQAAWRTVWRAMEQVVSHPKGTAHIMANPSYRIAGKTGTAQVVALSQRHRAGQHAAALRDHSLFIGFAPLPHPTLAVAVILEHQRGSTALAQKIFTSHIQGS